jgi:hypothetical protein
MQYVLAAAVVAGFSFVYGRFWLRRRRGAPLRREIRARDITFRSRLDRVTVTEPGWLQQLSGWFQYQSASVPLANGLGLSVVFFWGDPVIGIDLGLSLKGPAVNFIPAGVSDTWVYQLSSSWQANAARLTWDYLVGGGFVGGAFTNARLNFARWLVNRRRH